MKGEEKHPFLGEKTAMNATFHQKRVRLPRMANSLIEAISKLLTPAMWRQAHQHVRGRRRRWGLQPLVIVLLVTTWCCGDSLGERFEIAKAFCVVYQTKRRRPGKTLAGFQKALSKLPVAALKTLAAAMRVRLQSWFAAQWTFGEWVPFSVDGSRLQCPLTDESRRRLGRANREATAPCIWVTTLVQLHLGLLWAWRLGKGNASERHHFVCMLATLPARALVVADAGFGGSTVAQAVMSAGKHYLIRMCRNETLLTDGNPRGSPDQLVSYWPKHAEMPLRARLLRIRGRKGQHRYDVWLLTDILDKQRLSLEQASQLYRWRWRNEGMFRTYKRTMAKLKLLHRTVRLIHREVEGSLLATQLLLALGVWAVNPRKGQTLPSPAPSQCSPRQVLLIVRMEIYTRLGPRLRCHFAKRLAQAKPSDRNQKSAKQKRTWARRRGHKPPGPPHLLKITKTQKQRLLRMKSKNQGAFS
jgi:Transposase DDE domain